MGRKLKPIVCLTRREVFAASHRLHASTLSDDENRKLFGKCNHPHGHGHNYVLEVTIRSAIDSQSGLTMNLSDLKEIIQACVLSKVDHRHLNLDVPEFKSLNPTTENLAVVIWNWLNEKLPNKVLYEVKVYETENNAAFYRGESV